MHAALQVLQQPGSSDAPAPPAPRRWRAGTAGLALAAAAVGVLVVAAWPRLGAETETATRAAPVVAAPAQAAEATAAELALTERLDDASALVVLPPPAADTPALATVTVSDATPPAARAEPAAALEPVAALETDAAVETVAAVEPAVPAVPAAAVRISEAPDSTSPAPDDRAVALAVAAFDQAVRAGDFAAGQRQLDVLAGLLPARSLTLLRMKAWFAHQSGDAVQAIVLYREITERVPADDNAAINLALLEAGQGDVEGASERLRALRSRSGESAALSAAMAVVGAKRP